MFYFYCNLIVVNVAQGATIAKLGLGICHTQILVQLNFNLRKLEIETTGGRKSQIHKIDATSKVTNALFIVFFIFVLSLQALISFWPRIPIRVEYGT